MCSADQNSCRSRLGSNLVSYIVFSAVAPFSPTTLFQFCTTDVAGKPRYSWVGHALDLDKELFEAEFWRMLPADELRLPTTLIFADGKMLLGRRCPEITDELSLARLLHNVSDSWQIRVLKNQTVSIGKRLAIEATALQYEELLEKKDSAKGLKAVRQMTAETGRSAHGHVRKTQRPPPSGLATSPASAMHEEFRGVTSSKPPGPCN